MKHLEQMPKSARTRARTCAGTVLFLAVLGLTGCGGSGGGGGGSNPSTVKVQTVLPASGPFIGGTLIRVTGTRFLVGEENLVTVGGKPATDVVVVDEANLSCRTPSGTPGATVEVKVTNRLGAGRLAAGYSYNQLPTALSDINGDGIGDLVVGSPSDDTIGPGAGAVFVFFGVSDPAGLQNRTSAQADLKLTGHHAGDGFGTDFVIGDMTGDRVADLAIGASHVNAVGANDAGAVYVFRGPLAAAPAISALAANVRINGDTTLAGDRFGSSLEAGDVDGDGTCELVVGAPGHDVPGMVDAGCVYLFRGGATLVTKNAAQADMGFDGAGLNERVGNRLTCGDLNGDGEADLVICSQNADVQLDVLQQKAGKVYVVWGGSNLATTPVGNASATFVGTNVEDRFGASAAVADVNADGTADLIVGAPQADGTDVDAGKVYVFFGGPTLTGRQSDAADVILAGAPTHNSFGRVVRTGDVNGDSIMDLVIGAPEADYLNDDNGRAYLFLGGPGLANAFAVEAAAIYNGEQIQGEAFGAVVSIVDFNRDGLAEVVGSAPKHDFDAGRIYMWMSQQTGITAVHLAEQADVTFSGLQIGSLFGSQVAKGQ